MSLEVGYHLHVPEDVYHGDSAISQSQLKQAMRSLAHLRIAREGATEPTPAQKYGSLVHAMVLEPDSWRERYAISPKDMPTRRSKAGKDAWEAWEMEHAGKEFVTAEDVESGETVRNSVMDSPLWPLIQRGAHEVTIRWNHGGIPCRARIDAHSGPYVIDLKTSIDASPSGFPRLCAVRGYHIQGAFYLDGLAALGEFASSFSILAIEKSPPYAHAAYVLSDDAIERGRKQYKDIISIAYAAIQANNFPGYTPTIQTLELPSWY